MTLKSSTQKYKPTYKLKVTYEAPSGKKWEDKEIEGSYTQWFNAYGYLQPKELQAWLASNIEVLGIAQNENTSNSSNSSNTTTSTSIPVVVDNDNVAIDSAVPSFSSGTEPSVVPASAKKGRAKKKA